MPLENKLLLRLQLPERNHFPNINERYIKQVKNRKICIFITYLVNTSKVNERFIHEQKSRISFKDIRIQIINENTFASIMGSPD
jgi:hypothetical protein